MPDGTMGGPPTTYGVMSDPPYTVDVPDVPAPRHPGALADPVLPPPPVDPEMPQRPMSWRPLAETPQAQVKGRIDIADAVVEKVVTMAAREVDGVAGAQNVDVRIDDRDAAIGLTIAVSYGHLIVDVARLVKANVAASSNRMLGLRVAEVNVAVDDVVRAEPAPLL